MVFLCFVAKKSSTLKIEPSFVCCFYSRLVPSEITPEDKTYSMLLVAGMLLWCYNDVMMLWWCYDDMMMLWWCFDDVMMMLWWCYDDVTMVLWGYMLMLWWCYDGVMTYPGPEFRNRVFTTHTSDSVDLATIMLARRSRLSSLRGFKSSKKNTEELKNANEHGGHSRSSDPEQLQKKTQKRPSPEP